MRYVDNTMLRTLARCETAAALRHVLGYVGEGDESGPAAQAGIAMHEALAAYFRTGLVADAVAALEPYRTYSDAHGLGDPGSRFARLSYENVLRVLTAWIEDHPREQLPFTVEAVEVGFSVPLTDTVAFTGRIDAIVRSRHNGELYVVDHKTTARLTPDWVAQWKRDVQMSGYVWAVQCTLGQPVVGVYINAIELQRLPTSGRPCATHGVPYAECGSLHSQSQFILVSRSPMQLAEWRAEAIALAQQYEALAARVTSVADATQTRVQGLFTGGCTYCTFRDFCLAGRPPAYASTMLRHDPWMPHALAVEKEQ